METRQRKGILFTILLLLLVVCPAAATLTREQIEITPGAEWVIAGGDSTSFTVRLNASEGGTVRIWCTVPTLGTITSNAERLIQAGEEISVVFTSGTRSGEAEIRVNVTLQSGDTNETAMIQKVDHALPKYYAEVHYNTTVTVGTTTVIEVSLKDVYGNSVDTKRNVTYSESVTFRSSPEDDGGFWDGTSWVDTLPRTVNRTATITYRVPLRAGDNILQIVAPDSVVSNLRWITLTGTPGEPDHITSSITSPIDANLSAPHNATANGKDTFSLYYTLLDQYDNPVPGRVIGWKLESLGVPVANHSYLTNYRGQIYLEHGPSTVIRDYTATTSYTATINRTDILSYIEGAPSLLTLSASPETMASREMQYATVPAYVRAKLMDSLGRPLSGKTVTFAIESDTGVGSTLLTHASFDPDSTLNETFAVTGTDGYATVTFYPGEFPRRLEPGWSPNSTGTTVIKARSADLGQERTLTLVYKNYPYLRAETEVSPALVAANDTVDITVRLIGDGFAQYKPIDVMLCNNRGESMLQDMYWDSSRVRVEDKMVFLHEATNTFIFNLTPNNDNVGLVSFGIKGWVNLPHDGSYALPGIDNDALDNNNYTAKFYTVPQEYTEYATVDSPLSADLITVAAKMRNTTPSRDPQGTVLVPMRFGLYRSVNELKAQAQEDHVRGIILLTDSEWTAYGDPTAGWDGSSTAANQGYYENESSPINMSQGGLGRWTAFNNWSKSDSRQDMAHYASENQVHIYTIAYYKNSGNIPVSLNRVMQYLADSTGGKYYIADNAKALDEIYTHIAEDLRRYASVDTGMNLSFEHIDVTYDNATESFPGTKVFEYIPLPGVSTYINSHYKNGTPITELLPVPPYPANATPAPKNYKGKYYIQYPYTLNQSGQWSTGELPLYAGNISLGQIWEAKFRLKAMIPGFINVFGSQSEICYSNEEDPQNCIPMPATYLTVTQNKTGDPTLQNKVDIIDDSIHAAASGTGDLTAVSWNLNYTGGSMVTQDVYYQNSKDGSFWGNNWIRAGSVQTENGPIENRTYHILLDRHGTPGCFQIRIFAQEEVTPAGAYDEEFYDETICPVQTPSIKIT